MHTYACCAGKDCTGRLRLLCLQIENFLVACMQTSSSLPVRNVLAPQFPPMQPQAFQSYLQMFKRLDTDGDSIVQVIPRFAPPSCPRFKIVPFKQEQRVFIQATVQYRSLLFGWSYSKLRYSDSLSMISNDSSWWGTRECVGDCFPLQVFYNASDPT